MSFRAHAAGRVLVLPLAASIAAVAVLSVSLAGCSGPGRAGTRASVHLDIVDAAPPSSQPSASSQQPPSSQPSQTPIETTSLGEEYRFPDAAITVDTVEKADSIATDQGAPLTPEYGESLYLVSTTWTNNANQEIGRPCAGPPAVSLSVFDTQNRPMAVDSRSTSIAGNDCDHGVMSGSPSPWLVAVRGGPDARVGYLLFERSRTTPDETPATPATTPTTTAPANTGFRAVVVEDGLRLALR